MTLPVTIPGFERAARAVFDDPRLAYYLRGAGAEVTLGEAPRAWSWWAPRPRVLVDVTALDAGVTVFGQRWATPIGIAPTAAQAGVHPVGEAGLLGAAAGLGLPYVLSTSASVAPGDLAGTPGTRWFQLYVRGGVDGGRRQIDAAVTAGCEAIAVTVDLAAYGPRDQELEHPVPVNPASQTMMTSGDSLAALTWDGLATLVGHSPVPVLAKGILDARDAVLALEAGAAGIWVSTHGGRQLDTVLPSALVLPEIVESVAGRVPVFVDGGIQRGVSVAVALALGATAVFVGRLPLWGLAVGGQAGADAVLRLLVEEFRTTLSLMGVPRAADLNRDHVVAAPWRR